MSSLKGRLLRLVGGVALRATRVDAVEALAPAYRRIHVSGPALAHAGFQPGDKVQVLLPSLDVRTYTPIAWASTSTSFLVFLHGVAPGAGWARSVHPGDEIRFLGPQRSLAMEPGPLILVGDETSIAVAAAYTLARPGAVRAVLEAGDPGEAERVALAVGLREPTVVPRGAGADRYGPLVAAVLAASRSQSASIGITGNARLLQAVRAGGRSAGVPSVRVKAYWAEGKVGLD